MFYYARLVVFFTGFSGNCSPLSFHLFGLFLWYETNKKYTFPYEQQQLVFCKNKEFDIYYLAQMGEISTSNFFVVAHKIWTRKRTNIIFHWLHTRRKQMEPMNILQTEQMCYIQWYTLEWVKFKPDHQNNKQDDGVWSCPHVNCPYWLSVTHTHTHQEAQQSMLHAYPLA